MKKIYSFLLMLLMAVMSANTAKAYDWGVVAEGNGWQLYQYSNRSGLTLIITGSAACQDYASSNATPWAAYKNDVSHVDFGEGMWVVGTYMCADMPDLEIVNTRGEFQMIKAHAFENCRYLETINAEKVSSIGDYAFNNCKWLKSLNLTDPNFTTIGNYAFSGCVALETVGFASNISAFTIGDRAFYGCGGLKNIDLDKATSIGKYAFYNCSDLEYAYLWNCTSVGEFAFDNCSLRTIELGTKLSSIGKFAFSNGIVDHGAIIAKRSTPPTLGEDVFYGVNCSTVWLWFPDESYGTAYNKAPWNQFKRNAAGLTIYGVYSGTTLTLYYDEHMVSRGGSETWWNWEHATERNQTTKIIIDESMQAAYPESTSAWFYGFQSLTEIENMEDLNTGNVTDMHDMFSGCKSLALIDLSHFNTAKVTDMNNMFSNCENLISLDLNYFNMSSMTNTYAMFSKCKNLGIIYCESDWTIYSISQSINMFDGCVNLKGGKGTVYNASYVDITFARPDGSIDAPGYFWKAGDTGEAPEDPVDPQEGIDQTSQEPKANSQKLIRDGQLLIERNGKTYNAQGVEVR